jgi:tetratricopeptide (TPR) repeat protein
MRSRSPATTAIEPVQRRLAPAVILTVACVLVYANGLGGPFVIDDENSIVTNPSIRQLTPLSVPLSPPRETPVAGRPLVNLSFALNYAVSGLDVRGFRVTNLAIHLLAALVLFGVVRRALALDGIDPLLRARAREVAVVCSLLWMLHPLQTEVVNYVTQRTTSLMSLMYLLTMYCSIRAMDGPRFRWQAAAVLSCTAGMACKESMVTAPVMVALFDRVFVYPSVRQAVRQRGWLYGGLAASWLLLAALMAPAPRTSVGFNAGVDAWTYLINQATVIVDYLRLTIMPRALVIDYGVPRALTASEVLGPALAVLGMAAATLVALVRWPRLGFLGAWFFVTLAPTSSIVPIATEVGAERRMYLPLAAIVLLMVCLGWRAAAARRVPRTVTVAACLTLFVSLAAATILRNSEYRSRLVLAEKTVERRPHGRAFLRLGVLLFQSGRRSEGFDYVRRARQADATGARFVLGTEHLVDGDVDAGIRELTEFVSRHPGHANVIPAREMLGRAYVAQGRLDEAARQFAEVLRQVPTHAVANEQMGDLLLSQGRPVEALPHLRFVSDRRPGDVNALGKLGTAFMAAGRLSEAIPVLSRAVDADPRHAHARRMLGRAFAVHGRLEESVAQLQLAVDLDPQNPGARQDLEVARARHLEAAGR